MRAVFGAVLWLSFCVGTELRAGEGAEGSGGAGSAGSGDEGETKDDSGSAGNSEGSKPAEGEAPPPAEPGPATETQPAPADASATAPAPAAAQPPKPFQRWNPEVYEWGGKGTIGAYVIGGLGVGFIIGGDQWSRAVAAQHGGRTDRPVVFGNFRFADHVPRLLLDDVHDEDAGWIAQAFLSDYLFSIGLQGAIPGFAGGVAGSIVGDTGADLQTTKTVGCGVATATLIPTGIAHLVRWGKLFVPVWQAHKTDEMGFFYVITGIVPMAAGFADIAVGVVSLIHGILYGSGNLVATTEKGLFPSPLGKTQRKQSYKNSVNIPGMPGPIVRIGPDSLGLDLVGRW
jgi:hypothetical protein